MNSLRRLINSWQVADTQSAPGLPRGPDPTFHQPEPPSYDGVITRLSSLSLSLSSPLPVFARSLHWDSSWDKRKKLAWQLRLLRLKCYIFLHSLFGWFSRQTRAAGLLALKIIFGIIKGTRQRSIRWERRWGETWSWGDVGTEEFFQLRWRGGSDREESVCNDPSLLSSNKGRFEQISPPCLQEYIPLSPRTSSVYLSTLREEHLQSAQPQPQSLQEGGKPCLRRFQ